LINNAEVGYKYAVEVEAGFGGGHLIYLKDFDLQTNFAYAPVSGLEAVKLNA
jgi:hypothetical protein